MTEVLQHPHHIGERLRTLRFERRWTQGELAKRAGLNTATVCLIEKAKRQGTVTVHGKLARALGLTLSELYAGLEEGRRGPAAAFQSAPPKTESYAHPGMGFAMQPLITNVLEKRMMPVIVQLERGGATTLEQARAGSHTEKFLYVQAGTVEIRVGDERFTLRPHQSLYFDATQPHQMRNTTKQVARLFVVSSPPML